MRRTLTTAALTLALFGAGTSTALAAPMPEPTCTTESGGVPGENAYEVTRCESSTSMSNKNKQTTVTQSSQDYQDEEYISYDTSTTRETTTRDGNTRTRTESTHESYSANSGAPIGASECTSTYNSKTGKYTQKCK